MLPYMTAGANGDQCREANDDQQFTQRWLAIHVSLRSARVSGLRAITHQGQERSVRNFSLKREIFGRFFRQGSMSC